MNKELINLIITEPTFLFNSTRLVGDALLQMFMKQATEPVSEKNFLDSIQTIKSSSSISENEEAKYVSVIPIHGVVMRDGYGSTTYIQKLLDQYEADPNNVGVVFWMKTPGGAASGTNQLAHKVFNYSKTTATFMDFLTCSAGMYIAGATDKRFVNKYGDWVGSIGTMASMLDFIPMFEKWGAKYWELYADGSEDKNKSIRDLLNEGDDKLFKAELNSYREEFVNDMKLFMPELKDEVFTGKVYRPADAVKNGLADEFGTLQSTIQWVFAQSEQENQNINNMSKKNFANIALALGVTEVFASSLVPGLTAKTCSFSEEQLELLDSKIGGTEASALTERIAQLENELKVANEAKETASANLTALETAVNTAMTKNNLEDKGSAVANITELGSKTEEYGKRKDTKPTNVHAAQEVVSDDEDEVELESLVKTDFKNI